MPAGQGGAVAASLRAEGTQVNEPDDPAVVGCGGTAAWPLSDNGHRRTCAAAAGGPGGTPRQQRGGGEAGGGGEPKGGGGGRGGGEAGRDAGRRAVRRTSMVAMPAAACSTVAL